MTLVSGGFSQLGTHDESAHVADIPVSEVLDRIFVDFLLPPWGAEWSIEEAKLRLFSLIRRHGQVAQSKVVTNGHVQ